MAAVSKNIYMARRAAAMKAADRLDKVRPDAFLATMPEDVSYFTGFTGDDSFAFFSRDLSKKACLLTDGRYDEQARNECPGIEINVRRGSSMSAAVAEVAKAHKVRRLAVQAEHLTLRWHEAFGMSMPRVKLLPTHGVPVQLRQVKDDGEIAAIKRAIKVAQTALKSLMAQGSKAFVGRTERQVAAEIDYRMRLAGADKPSFDTIVAAGPNGSMPHYRPGNRRIRQDDPVLIDWGAFVDGYCSDLTRVVFTGRIPPKLAEIYETVRKAQQAGIAAVKAGVAIAAVDSAARAVIERAGYGKQFVHGLGHGIGRQIHELPGIGQQGTGRLRAGMVVTVEPGIYLPGVGGVRIEDDVLVGRQGPCRLSSLPTALAAMTLK